MLVLGSEGASWDKMGMCCDSVLDPLLDLVPVLNLKSPNYTYYETVGVLTGPPS